MTGTRSEDTIHRELGEGESYGAYLRLDLLLAAQQPRGATHDEMLFIVIHQASELWMKLLLHELAALMGNLRTDALDDALKMFARVARIQQQLIQSWDVLATMTPSDYSRLRPSLGRSSGFQSHQYRVLEFLIGNKDAALAEVHRSAPEIFGPLEAVLDAPSLYDETLRLLARRGFALPPMVTERDWREPYSPCAAVEAAWLAVYGDTETYWDLYDLAEKLVDLEDRFQQWRFRHMKTVERIIGRKSGTGGSSGVGYLSSALDLKFFPELWSIRTAL